VSADSGFRLVFRVGELTAIPNEQQLKPGLPSMPATRCHASPIAGFLSGGEGCEQPNKPGFGQWHLKARREQGIQGPGSACPRDGDGAWKEREMMAC